MLPLLTILALPDFQSDRTATTGSSWRPSRTTAPSSSAPVAPELVYLYGADEVRNDPASTEDFRSLLANIPSGSLLYRMYGKATRNAKQIYIGSITTESAFVASEFGDRILGLPARMGSEAVGAMN